MSKVIELRCDTCYKKSGISVCLECAVFACSEHMRHHQHSAWVSSDEDNEISKNLLIPFRPPRVLKKGIKGILNIGNTCFLAASLQCLSHVWAFQKVMRHVPPFSPHELQAGVVSGQQRLVIALRKFFLFQWGDPFAKTDNEKQPSSAASYNPEEILGAVQRLNSSFHGYHQHDSQEFLRFLITTLNESFSEKNFVSDTFKGKTCSTVKCLKCLKVSTCIEDFFDLSLPIPTETTSSASLSSGGGPISMSVWQKLKAFIAPGQSQWFFEQQRVSLKDCFELFLRPELLSGSEAYMCESCKTQTDCIKQMSIHELPKTLVLHLKRFKHEWTSSKLAKPVSFPVDSDLDLAPSSSYRLSGIIQHSGSIHSGHYTAFCRHKTSGQWYCFDDSKVSLVPNLSQIEKVEAYVLFFQQTCNAEMISKRDSLKRARALRIEEKSQDEIAFIPRKWVAQQTSLLSSSPSCIDQITCPHMKPSTTCPVYAKSVFVSVSRKYAIKCGFENPLKNLQICTICQEFINKYNLRLSWEQKLVAKFDSKNIPKDQVWFFLDSSWVAAWRKYLRSGPIADYNKACSPGPVQNQSLVDRMKKGTTLKLTADFIAVNQDVWTLFAHCHGVHGPVITSKVLDLADSHISDSIPDTLILRNETSLVSEQEWEKIGSRQFDTNSN